MDALAPSVCPKDVKAVRAFNRFYTQRIGVLKRYLDTDFTLTEVRVLYEIAHRPGVTATALVRDLSLDAGYLSRILRRFEQQGWLGRRPSEHDARQGLLSLTAAGHATFAPLQQKSREETAQLLASVPDAARGKLVASLRTVQGLLAPPADRLVELREHRPGDLGWIVQAHAEIYARDYGFDASFEALVAQIAARFLLKFDPAWERAWIAEVDGQRAGSVLLVRQSRTVAKLRLLILAPEARGLGLGGQLTDTCIAFAREKGYRKLVLWTQSNLVAARAIYRSRGFVKAASEKNRAFGQRLVSETWELKL